MHQTQAPANKLSPVELLAWLLKKTTDLRQAKTGIKEIHELRTRPQSWTAKMWFADVINAVFNDTVCEVVGDQLHVFKTYKQFGYDVMLIEALGNGEPGEYKEDGTYFTMSDFALELIRRENEFGLDDLLNFRLMNAEALASADFSNEELLGKFREALQACDPSAVMQLTNPEERPRRFLEANFRKLGVHDVVFVQYRVQLIGLTDELLSAIEQHFGVSDQRNYVRLAPWVVVMLARIGRGEMPEVYKT